MVQVINLNKPNIRNNIKNKYFSFAMDSLVSIQK